MISVLLPVYNTKSDHLKECIDSILDQTLETFEIVIIDNESTDKDTIETLSYFSSLSDSGRKIKLEVVKREPGKKNLSVALNAGLQLCEFRYVARMDSDDIMLPQRLEKQIDYMMKNPGVDILGCQLKNMFEDQHVTSHPLKIMSNYYKFSTHFLNHPCVMFKKDKILAIGGYQESPDHIPEDFLLWAKALKCGYIIDNLPEVLVHYRNKKDGALSLMDSQYPEWYNAIYKAINT